MPHDGSDASIRPRVASRRRGKGLPTPPPRAQVVPDHCGTQPVQFGFHDTTFDAPRHLVDEPRQARIAPQPEDGDLRAEAGDLAGAARDLRRAAEAGASMANMVSGYGGIRWGTGMSRAFQYEQQQSRMKYTPWERPDL